MKRIFFNILITGAILLLMPGMALPFCFDEAGNRFMLSPRLLESIAAIESGMNPVARNQNRNGSTDFGLMQVNSYWIKAANLDKERLLNDACYNTLAGARVLRGCVDRYGNSWEAVGCYNASSSEKRKSYAWKIYRQLVSETKKKQQTTPPPKPIESTILLAERSNGYFSFTIEDTETAVQMKIPSAVEHD